MRAWVLIGVVALAACEGSTELDDPKYSAGGTSPYGQYLTQREAALQGKRAAPQTIPVAVPHKSPTAADINGPGLGEIAERELAVAGARVTTAVSGRPVRVRTSQGTPDIRTLPVTRGAPQVREYPDGKLGAGPVVEIEPAAAPITVTTPPSVAAAATVRSDPAPTRAQAAAATSAPASGRYGGSTPALVRYAFVARHAPGTSIYRRNGGSRNAALRACRSYPNAASAQTAFLAKGGPQADPLRLDPDGDGFVCGWDPAPYRVDSGL